MSRKTMLRKRMQMLRQNPPARKAVFTHAVNAVLGDPKDDVSRCNLLAQRPSDPPLAVEPKPRTVCDLSPEEGWAHLRRKAQQLAKSRGEWAGMPMLSNYQKLVLEKRYPYPEMNGAWFGKDKEPAPVDESIKFINHWYCQKNGVGVCVYEENGKRYKYFTPNGSGARQEYALNTLGIAAEEIWSIEAETEALAKLKELVTRQAYKCYFLSGMFLETSKRSNVTYLFRKLRPTLALRPDKSGNMQILTALCLHPLGYYEHTYAGVMTPTDDVIAHLMMCRVDERKFWSKANHHPQHWASAGV